MMQSTFIKRFARTLSSFEGAVKTLNSLQSNAAYLKSAEQKKLDNLSKLCDTEKYLLRSGITLEKLDTLSVIHVAGTKGKGSACAYTEAILREHGYRTGFFSSPHLVHVRERIRINGKPISELCFTQYFWDVYKKLEETRKYESEMPTYFKFLTVLMFNIFLDRNIDVAIIEVGIGGLLDCTNIVRNPVCVGITSLGLDHTSLLGNTIEDIAYQKSGIFKPKTVAFSVPQLPQAMSILKKRAVEIDCTLHIVPPFEKYTWHNLSPILKISNNHVQQQNASLAIQLAANWLLSKGNIPPVMTHNEYIENSESVSMDKIAIGLSSCEWPGRMQILRSNTADFYLDGAHTVESMECCISWFNDVSSGCRGKRILIFNTSGHRDPEMFLKFLKPLNFSEAYFVPNFAGIESVDDEMNRTCIDKQKEKCKENSEIWGAGSIVGNNVAEVLNHIKINSKLQSNCNNNEKCHILVTGSLHLVGAVLTILDPNLTMKTQYN